MHRNKDKKVFSDRYDSIITTENLLLAWRKFKSGKGKRPDVQEFEMNLIENLLALQTELRDDTYRHGTYHAFKINDPKPRDIHKALVRDRVLHHLLYRSLSPFFFRTFIADSYSCQLGKGTHKALDRFSKFARAVSKNNTKQCFVLKCDIKKFFASIDQVILLAILQERITDERLHAVLRIVVDSFNSGVQGKGLPLGNLTSQLLVNIYMHEFDVYMKQTLRVRYYIRYADDFVVFSEDWEYLKQVLSKVRQFLEEKLALTLHPCKVTIETLSHGVDFLGWVHFPYHKVLRVGTRRRMQRMITINNKSSYIGMLQYGNTYALRINLILKDSGELRCWRDGLDDLGSEQ